MPKSVYLGIFDIGQLGLTVQHYSPFSLIVRIYIRDYFRGEHANYLDKHVIFSEREPLDPHWGPPKPRYAS